MERVLIIEDDIDLVETYTDLLENHDYEVASVSKAMDAITVVSRFRPDVVLLDLNLAGYSGTVVINLIRGYPSLKNTKIVVVTGHPEMLNGARDSSRVDLILNKPVTNDQLLATVRQFSSADLSEKGTC
jgi:CheY-like chemotaxis protein